MFMNSLNVSCLGDSIVSIQEEIKVLRQRLMAFEESSLSMSLFIVIIRRLMNKFRGKEKFINGFH